MIIANAVNEEEEEEEKEEGFLKATRKSRIRKRSKEVGGVWGRGGWEGDGGV